MSSYDGPPPPKTAAARIAAKYFYLYWLALCMHMALLIMSILAYTGRANREDLRYMKDVYITFTAIGHHTQRAYMAIAALSMVVEFYLSIAALIYVYRLRGRNYDEDDLFRAIRVVTFGCIPWHVICLVIFGVLLGLGATYVPLLSDELSECNSHGSDLTQCPLLDGTWILSIFYCLWHVLQVYITVRFRHYLVHFIPEDENDGYDISQQPANTSPVTKSALPSRPPSYRANIDHPPKYPDIAQPRFVARNRDT